MDASGWRLMRSDDIEGVVAVAAACFPEHFEARACFVERHALYPRGCFVLLSGQGVSGYLIAYPQPFGSIPPLNSLLGTLPQSSDALYLHDLAVHPDARGGGLTRPIVSRLITSARGSDFRMIHLVSVNGSAPFWSRLGFSAVDTTAEMTRKLQSYGEGATYMAQQVTPLTSACAT